MSAEIKGSSLQTHTIRLIRDSRMSGTGIVTVRLYRPSDGTIALSVLEDDFLAAVEAECDGIFVRRAELPEVTEDGEGAVNAGEGWYSCRFWTAIELRKSALADLALAEYMDAHPPMDETQVEALIVELKAVDGAHGFGKVPSPSTYRDMAADLYRAGVRVVTA